MIMPLEKFIVKSAKQLTEQNVNSACVWIMNQPKLPARAVEKLKKYQ